MPHFYSRREILKLFGITPMIAAAGTAVANSDRWWGKSMRQGDGPKLFFTADELPAMRRRWSDNPRFSAMREGLLGVDRAADRKFLREEINLKDPLHDIRRAGDRAQDMAWVYLMTGDDDAASLALECVRKIMEFPVWDFFLEGGDKVVGVQRAPSTTIAVSVVTDFLGDLVPAAERKEWMKQLAEKGCEPCYVGLHNIRYPRECVGWDVNPETPVGAERLQFPNDSARRPEITQETNLRASPSGALAIGLSALALYGDDHSQIDRWLEMAVSHLKAFEQIYLPDGGYGEGVHYADYTSRSIITAVQALNTSGVLPLELDIDWVGYVNSALNLSMATTENPYEVVNIGDNGVYRHMMRNDYQTGKNEMRTEAPYWVARKFRDGRAKWFGENLGAGESIWSLAYYDESVTPIAPKSGSQNWRSDLDWVVARTGFEAQDLVVSLRSGVGFNHEHADRNSLIVKAFGEQLIADPSRPPYNFHDPAWIMRETAGHSAALVDGKGHLYNNGVEGTNSTICQARIVAQDQGEGYVWWTSDATQAYRVRDYNIRAVVRSLVVFHDFPAVVVVDRFTKWREESEFETRYFGYNWDDQAKLSVTGGGFSIQRPGAKATAKLFCRDRFSVDVETLPIPEERAVQHPFVTLRSGRGMATTMVAAIGLTPTGGQELPVEIKAVGDIIEVSIQAAGRRARVKINDDGDVPKIEATV